jgi:hypothetical protein
MAETPSKSSGIRTARAKPRVMQAALLLWAHRIYHSADEAVKAKGGYVSYSPNSDSFRRYVEVIQELRALASRLDAMAGRSAPPVHVTGGCEDDQDCPDDQICVHGNCEPLFPQD